MGCKFKSLQWNISILRFSIFFVKNWNISEESLILMKNLAINHLINFWEIVLALLAL